MVTEFFSSKFSASLIHKQQQPAEMREPPFTSPAPRIDAGALRQGGASSKSGRCLKHSAQYGEVAWNPSDSATCPVCDAENEIKLQSRALIYMTKRMEEMRSAKQITIEAPDKSKPLDPEFEIPRVQSAQEEEEEPSPLAHSEGDDPKESIAPPTTESKLRFVMLSADSVAQFEKQTRLLTGSANPMGLFDVARSYGLDLVRNIVESSPAGEANSKEYLLKTLIECMKASGYGTVDFRMSSAPITATISDPENTAVPKASENTDFIQGMVAGMLEYFTKKKMQTGGQTYDGEKRVLTLRFVYEEEQETKETDSPEELHSAPVEDVVELPTKTPTVSGEEFRDDFVSDPKTMEAVIDTVRAIQEVKKKIASFKAAPKPRDEADYDDIEDLLSSI
ncbi:MAG TPA: hypothetical protein VFF30_12475 [Nitrososphaerales archaeon]|nr:hypothetical protein [Nitrososphaerales archaeon]